MFIGRKKELETLENLYSKNQFSMIVIYGRRRIGKSTLIKEFIKDKESIFYTSSKVGALRNQELFQQEVLKALNPDMINATFHTFDDVCTFISNSVKQKIVIVIDELPYWASEDSGMLSVLQKHIDNVWKNKNIMLILCGSSLSFMEEKVLSEKSPLFGRRTAQINLKSFDYYDSAKFVENYSLEDKAIVYGLTSGVPKYLESFDPNETLDDNIKRLFFDVNGYLFEEPKNLLVQEFKDVALVNNIVEQIANGENTLNDISNKVHSSSESTSYVLNKLIHLDLVEKKHCILEENNKKKTLYVLKDTMFQFWYKYIPTALSVIEVGNGFQYYDAIVKPTLHSYMGNIFEKMCQYYLLKNGTNLFHTFITSTGFWWGNQITCINDKKTIIPTDIDVVAISSIDKTAIIGECKFKNSLIDKDVYLNLLEKDSLVKGYDVTQHVFFSLSGYSEWVIENKTTDCVLLTLEDLYK